MSEVALRRFVISACDGPFGSAIKTDHYVDEVERVRRVYAKAYSDELRR